MGETEKVYKQKVHVFTTKIGSKMHTFESIFTNFLGGVSPDPLVDSEFTNKDLKCTILTHFFSKKI